ncbi:MAG TPA: STAS domain-containing protein [Burkholderiales bacterium]|nr:STAS domain-containing protein [Burkholderiales bacterium]
MIRREGEALVLEGAVTVDTVPGLIGAADEHLRQGAKIVDFREVTEVDSGAVALALEWLREAGRSQTELRLVNLPAPMQNLAKLYGVSELLQFPAA